METDGYLRATFENIISTLILFDMDETEEFLSF